MKGIRERNFLERNILITIILYAKNKHEDVTKYFDD